MVIVGSPAGAARANAARANTSCIGGSGEGLAVAYTQSAKWKETHWERPDYDAMLNKANPTVDDAERQKLFQQTGELLAKEGGVVIPMFVHQVLALRKGCEGYTPRAQNFNLNFEDLSCSK